MRDALRALQGRTRGATIVKLRAFVAGSGDLRRVRDLVSETFTERRQPLPVLSLVQAGALPLEGAQVVIESTALAKKEVNPSGAGVHRRAGGVLGPAARSRAAAGRKVARETAHGGRRRRLRPLGRAARHLLSQLARAA